jgi:histone-arginine methyltransferase CARM1
MDTKINLINKRIEDISEEDIPKIDTLISEPLGVLLVNERMLESYLKARDK